MRNSTLRNAIRAGGARRLLSQMATVAAVALAVACGSARLSAQASTTTASRAADLQAGGYYAGASGGFPDIPGYYGPQRLNGFGGYATLDFKPHFGVEVNIRQLNSTTSNKLHERTYEFGGRYVRHYGRFNPYGRVSYGRGQFQFPNVDAILAYNFYALGGGVDVNLTRSVNLRADYDYQKWSGFPLGLSPQVVSIGAAYHFH